MADVNLPTTTKKSASDLVGKWIQTNTTEGVVQGKLFMYRKECDQYILKDSTINGDIFGDYSFYATDIIQDSLGYKVVRAVKRNLKTNKGKSSNHVMTQDNQSIEPTQVNGISSDVILLNPTETMNNDPENLVAGTVSLNSSNLTGVLKELHFLNETMEFSPQVLMNGSVSSDFSLQTQEDVDLSDTLSQRNNLSPTDTSFDVMISSGLPTREEYLKQQKDFYRPRKPQVNNEIPWIFGNNQGLEEEEDEISCNSNSNSNEDEVISDKIRRNLEEDVPSLPSQFDCDLQVFKRLDGPCVSAINYISKQSCIGLEVFMPKKTRYYSIDIIAISCQSPSSDIFVFVFIPPKGEENNEGEGFQMRLKLKELLENKLIKKIMHSSKEISDVLYHRLKITLTYEDVEDLQDLDQYVLDRDQRMRNNYSSKHRNRQIHPRNLEDIIIHRLNGFDEVLETKYFKDYNDEEEYRCLLETDLKNVARNFLKRKVSLLLPLNNRLDYCLKLQYKNMVDYSLKSIRDLTPSDFKQREQDEKMGRPTDVIVDVLAEEDKKVLTEVAEKSKYASYNQRPLMTVSSEKNKENLFFRRPKRLPFVSPKRNSLPTSSDEASIYDGERISETVNRGINWETGSSSPCSVIVGGYEGAISYGKILSSLGHRVRY